MPRNLQVSKFFLFVLIMSLVFAPLSQVNAGSGPTSVTPAGGGSIYSFPIRSGIPAHQPDLSDPKLVASGFGNPAVDAPIIAIGDDRENTDPTSWYVYEHQTSTDVLNTATLNNLRVVDLSVENTVSPFLYTAVYVPNTGSYAKNWWFLANVTPTDLLNFVVANNARIVVSKVLNDPAPGGDVRYFAVMISNTGADAKTWWFYKNQTVAEVTALWQANNARLVQVNSYVKNATTFYDVVMISNTGSDARTWFWYVNASISDISTHLTANNARLVDLDIDPTTGNYNVVMQACSGGCPAWWWYVGVSTSNLINTALTNGARIIDASVTSGCGDQCWSILLLDNSHTTLAGNAALAGVRLSYLDGGAKSVTADAAGDFGLTVPTGWSGTLTPLKPGYHFTPASRIYSNVFSNQLGENFTATAVATFADVPVSYWSWQYIERLYSAGITSGCSVSPLNYCPTNSFTRGQMAVFLLRGMHGSAYTPPPATGTKFADVSLGTFGAAWIEELATEGITSGCGGGNYCPNQFVTRAQMAIFLVRAKHGIAFVPPIASGIFPDVPVGSFGANYIEQLVADGITSGCGGGLYCPNATVKRDSMAVFLVKNFSLP